MAEVKRHSRASGSARKAASRAGSKSAGGKRGARASATAKAGRDSKPATAHREEKGSGATRARRDSKAASGRSNGAGRSRGLSAMQAVRSARENIGELLGRPVESVLGVDRDHGNWVVTAQVVELERVPNTMDVLGDYEAVLDKDGEVIGCRRTHRYRRGQVDEAQS